MPQNLQVLMIEDNPADAELLVRELRRAGFSPVWERVDTEAGVAARLRPDLDIILFDYSMPGFTGLRALEMLRKSGLDVPFILISGTIGEDVAVEAMKKGAADYLLKDRLGRLGPAIQQAIEKARLQRERAKAECALSLFRTLVDHSSDTIEVIDPATSRILDVNENGPTQLGFTREEYLSLRVIDIDASVTRENWPVLAEKIRRNGSSTGEGWHIRKDGTRFPVEFNAKWVSLDRDYIVTVVRDVTERKRTEERFRRLVDSNAQGVVFRRTDGGISEANDAFLKIVGYDREDLEAGRLNWLAMTPPEFAGHNARCLEEMAATGVCSPYEKEYFRKDGSRVPVLVGAAAFEYDPQEGVAFVVDLTGFKELERQFLRAQRLEGIGTLAGGIAHDLNNVLAPIIMSLDLLKLRFPDPSSRDLLSILSTSAHHGADMVRQVLSFARGVEGSRIEVQIKHLLREIEAIANETFLKNIRVLTILPADLKTVLGDPTQLHQVLLNLCINARDAMPLGGQLTLTAENQVLDSHCACLDPQARPGPYVVIQVGDNGTGIPPEIQAKIFDPFFTTKEVSRGTGLGLSTSLGIVKSHGGFIRVESEPGKGTLFKVYLPAWTGVPAGASQELKPKLPRGSGELILVVDDEETVREITRQTLEAFGYRVVLAADGAEAVGIYDKRGLEITAVLTDMSMPGMDGPATIEILRKINPEVRILAVSGFANDANLSRAAACGVRGFLIKPYTAETLLRSIRQVIQT